MFAHLRFELFSGVIKHRPYDSDNHVDLRMCTDQWPTYLHSNHSIVGLGLIQILRSISYLLMQGGWGGDGVTVCVYV